MDSYRNALSVLDINEWPELLTKLESPNVLEALNAYVSAYTAGMDAVNAHKRTQSRRTQRMAWRKLITLL